MSDNNFEKNSKKLWRSSGDPYVSLEGVRFDRDGSQILKGIDLHIYRNEIFSILGPSGCGKTTLLRIIAGLEKPTSGKIFIDGVDVTHFPPYDRPVSMMFQSYALFPHMTVRENIEFALRQDKKNTSSDIEERVLSVLKIVKLERYSSKNIDNLSGGERQRVALARCIAKMPKLICLDEPLGALDKNLRADMQFELVRIQEETGITFIVVTHDQEEAMTISSRIAVMDNGFFIQIGTPTDIYEAPASRFVGTSVGLINIFDGVVSKVYDKGVIVQSQDMDFELKVASSHYAPIGSHVSAAIRPEKIEIYRYDDSIQNDLTNKTQVTGIIVDIRYLGDVSIYHVKMDSSAKMILVTRQNDFRLIQMPLTFEDRVILTWCDTNSLIFYT